jgi:hypothetical protein
MSIILFHTVYLYALDSTGVVSQHIRTPIAPILPFYVRYLLVKSLAVIVGGSTYIIDFKGHVVCQSFVGVQ